MNRFVIENMGISGFFFHRRVGSYRPGWPENDPSTIIAHNHAFIQGLKNTLYLLKPLRSSNADSMPLFQTARRSCVSSERLPNSPRLIAIRKNVY